jgi:hypothetical protein
MLQQHAAFGGSSDWRAAAAAPSLPTRRGGPCRPYATAQTTHPSSPAAPAGSVAKRLDAAELAAEVERLRAENEALRVALAGYQKCGPAEVTVATAVDAASAAAPAAAAATAADIAAQLEAGILWPSPEEGSFWERPPRNAPMPLGPASPAAGVQRDPRSMHVVHITAEMAPYAKVGGLGDVVTGLARACLARGHNVEIMLPVRRCLSCPSPPTCPPVACFAPVSAAAQYGPPPLALGAAAGRGLAGVRRPGSSATLLNPRLRHPLACVLPLQFYECLPQDAVEDLRLEREFDCPKARRAAAGSAGLWAAAPAAPAARTRCSRSSTRLAAACLPPPAAVAPVGSRQPAVSSPLLSLAPHCSHTAPLRFTPVSLRRSPPRRARRGMASSG